MRHRVHRLKTIDPYFNDVVSGAKNFEVRLNDRGYRVGDTLELVEIVKDEPTGKTFRVKVKYILEGGQFGIQAGYVVLGF